eukprot:Opistho-2@88826
MRPWPCTICATARCSAASSITSRAIASAPAWPCTKSSSSDACRADTSTRAPRACRAVARARPMPLEAPTSQTVRPTQSRSLGFSGMAGSEFLEGQSDLAEAKAELAHLRLVEHDFVVDQIHPIVEVHLIPMYSALI